MLERHDRQFHELYCVEHYRKGSGELEWPMQTLVMANSEEDAIELVKAWHDGLTGGQDSNEYVYTTESAIRKFPHAI